MPSKQCPVQRPVWGFAITEQAPALAGLSGGARVTNINAQTINSQNHELVPLDMAYWGDYMLMCKHCADIGSQSDWFEVLRQPAPPNQNHVKGG